MLAYVFWHWPASGIAADRYVERLVAFHRIFAANPSPGFRGSEVFAIEGQPWSGAAATGANLYEDWYFIDDFTALGALNEAAVTVARKDPHDTVAKLAGGGAGGVYRNMIVGRVGDEVSWFAKPPGTTYEELFKRMPHGNSLWMRQMVLGPAPEFRLAGPPPAGIEAHTLRVRSVYRS
ncbi:MAG: hypothetical protein ACJ79G_15300 [Myxococcales bacterium]